MAAIWLLPIAAFVLLLVCLFRTSRAVTYVSLMLLFQFVWIATSVLYIESGPAILLVSTWTPTSAIGAFPALMTLYSAFLVGVIVAVRVSRRILSPAEAAVPANSGPWQTLWQLAALSAASLLLLNAVISPNALNSDVERADFYTTAVIPLAATINIAMPALLFVSSHIFSLRFPTDPRAWRVPAATFGAALSASYFSGVQFSGYVTLIFASVTPLLISRQFPRRLLVRIGVGAAVGVAAAAIYKFSSFADSTDYGNLADSGIDRFLYRAFALQGEVFWKTYLLYADSPDYAQIGKEVDVFFHRQPDTASGIFALMSVLVPGYTGDFQYTLNAGYPAILVMIFGFGVLAVLVSVGGGVVFGAAAVIVVREASRNSATGVFAAYGLLSVLYLAFTMGGSLYLGSTAAVLSATLLCLLIVHRALARRSSRLRTLRV